jgi:hypothetical protein
MNNPHAFPIRATDYVQLGMTLRDYFAAKAMQGFLADGAAPDVSKKIISIMAYAMADAMLKKREVSMIEEDDDIQIYQRTWVDLTDEEMRECDMDGDFMVDREIAKLNVQAKLKEKNNG